MNTANQSWQSFVPPSVNLYYVDHREDLDEHEDLQEQCIRKNNLDAIREAVFDWYMEQERENLTDTIDEIEKKMSEDGRYDEFKEHAEEISYLIYERNDTDPTEDLISHSTVTNLFYSLGVEIDGYSAYSNTRGETETMACYRVRRALKLKKGQYDDEILELVQNASYGGELRIYFNAMFDKLLTGDSKADFRTIRFHGDVVVAIADSRNGSGYHIRLPLDITFPFRRDNLFVDSQVHYSYANEVCGMSNNWCDSTGWETGMQSSKGSILTSKMTEHQLQETAYEKTFREGKCTFGDMNYKRHRNTFYINDFPCGSKCPHCGTFWID